jgi:hypothetical protein
MSKRTTDWFKLRSKIWEIWTKIEEERKLVVWDSWASWRWGKLFRLEFIRKMADEELEIGLCYNKENEGCKN